MAVSPVDQSIARTVPTRTPRTVAPLMGSQARTLAESQGLVWGGIVGATSIGERVEIGDTIDARGDAEMRVHLQALIRAAGIAKRERCYEVHSILVDEIARTHRLIEWDDAEDDQRHATGAEAVDMGAALGQSNRIHGLLLGQAEALSLALERPA